MAAMPTRDQDWADSLWLAADSYDRAGARQFAIRHLLEYIAGRPIDDPRRAEVTFRLAQAHEAEREYEDAIRVYTQVIDEHPRSTHGTRSHVRLARAYLGLDQPAEAERELLRVVEGRQRDGAPLTPAAVDYRDALIELGRLYYDTGRTTEAIERLTVAVERYPADERIDEIRFWLADSHRRHGLALRKALETDGHRVPRDRIDQQLRADGHLETALELFTRAAEGYAARDARWMSSLRLDYQRWASLYRGDCAYELGRFAIAAELYDQAARRYSSHHASMHALVQIINCFDRLGDWRDADIAHHNAMIRLRQLPDETFDDPEALMDRAAWERWLESRPVGVAAGTESPLN
jgi:tetratricopeptide (TPR) repeat protein